MNYWYSSHPDEIFLDLDSNRAIARALSVLRLVIRQKKLAVREVWLFGTLTKGHAHLIVTLKQELSLWSRVAWSLWLGNDRLRAAYVLERATNLKLHHYDLLISRAFYHRVPDAFCHCKKKHKDPNITDDCPAMFHLLGDHRSADYFARTGSAPPHKKIRVPWGKVSLTRLRHWRGVYE